MATNIQESFARIVSEVSIFCCFILIWTVNHISSSLLLDLCMEYIIYFICFLSNLFSFFDLFLTFFICFLCFDFPRRKFVSYCFDEDIVSFLYGSPLRQIKNRLKVGVRSSHRFCCFIGFQWYFLFKVDSPSYHITNNLTIIPAYIELAILIKLLSAEM
jgi:hypothetical protein